MSTDASAVLLFLVDADVVDVFVVCLLVVVCADVVVDVVALVVLVILFGPSLPDVVVDNDVVDLEDKEKAVLDVLHMLLQAAMS